MSVCALGRLTCEIYQARLHYENTTRLAYLSACTLRSPGIVLRGLVCQRRPACATCVYISVRMHVSRARLAILAVLPSSMLRNITRCSHLDILLAEPVVRTNVKLCDARFANDKNVDSSFK